MTLPLLLSVPHAGLEVPSFLADRCTLPRAEIVRDGDEGAAEIYALQDEVSAFVTTGVARAVLDMNRAEGDRRKDGIVKTHTCWDVPIWSAPLTDAEVERLLDEHHRPYHAALTGLAGSVPLGVDCHTMAAFGPPVGPDPGVERPMVCLGDGGGVCPAPWVEDLRLAFEQHLPGRVTVNEPFGGGHITRTHGREMPWIQIELSRSPALDPAQKRSAVLAALSSFCRARGW